MAGIVCKEEPNLDLEIDQDFSSLVMKNENIEVKYEDNVPDVIKIKTELDSVDYLENVDDYINPEVSCSYIKQDDFQYEDYYIDLKESSSCIKEEINNTIIVSDTLETDKLTSRKLKKGVWTKAKLNRLKKRIQGLFREYNTHTRIKSASVENASSIRRSSSRNVCVFCYFCKKSFLNVHHLWFHLARCHLVIKSTYRTFPQVTEYVHGDVLVNSGNNHHVPDTKKYLFGDHTKSDVGVKREKCHLCFKTFKNKSYLKGHMILHTDRKEFRCDICSKQFRHKRNLNSHLTIHTGVTSILFNCDVCTKQFKHKSSLNKHKKLHTRVTPLKCNVCSKQFLGNDSLREHVQVHMSRRFKCEICLKAFKRKSYLNIHMHVHTGVKPFQCEICLKEFKRKCYLSRHMSLHTDEKFFKCTLCTKAFQQQYGLNRHMKSHIKPYKCEICFKQFIQKRSLANHYKIHPGVELS